MVLGLGFEVAEWPAEQSRVCGAGGPFGIRVGTPAVTTQGMGTAEMVVIADLIDRAVTQTNGDPDHPVAKEIRAEVTDLVGRFPAYPRLSS